jgi:outer membrane protein TolC
MGIILLSVLETIGCTSFEPRPLEPVQSATQLEERSLADPSLRAFVAANLEGSVTDERQIAWDFDTLTLVAFYFHPELDLARAQWALAEAGRITAGERPNPTAGVAPAYNTTTADPSPRIVTANLDFTLETAGKRGFRIAQALQLSEAARLNISSVAWQVRGRVRSSLLDLYAADQSQALLRQQQTIHAENVRLLELQYQAGAISAFELTQARLASINAGLALHDAERQTADAGVHLADAIGMPVRALDEVEFSFEAFGRQPVDLPDDEVRHQALLSRPDILGALAEYAASQSKLQLEIAKQYPDVQLGPGYEYDQGDNKWSLGFSATLPLFHRNQGAIAEAQARRAESAARFNALQARVLAEIEIAVADYRAALRKYADVSALLADLGRQEKAARSMLEVGEISRSDLEALQLELSASALAGLDARLQALRSAGQLEDAIQSPFGLPPAVWQNAPRISQATGANERP